MARRHFLGTVLALACVAAAGAPDPRMLGAAGYAKIVCSAVFVSGRAVEEARRNSTYFLATDEDRAAVSAVDVDPGRREVRVTVRSGGSRRARYTGDQGCVIVPEHGEISFRPVLVRTALPAAATQPWPMGDAPDDAPWPPDVDRRAIDVAVARAFADPEALTAAFILVHRGRLLAERYAAGIDKDTQLESWSMGKTVLATLMALLIKDGTYRLDAPAPIPAWRVRMGKVALVAPAGMTSTGGRSASRLKKSPEFACWTTAPLAGAGAVRVTVPVDGLPDLTAGGVSVSDETCGAEPVGEVDEGMTKRFWEAKLAGLGLEVVAETDVLAEADRNGLL